MCVVSTISRDDNCNRSSGDVARDRLIVKGRPATVDPKLADYRPFQSVQTDMGDDLVAAAFPHHRDRAVTVHLASALHRRDPTLRQRQNPLSGGHFRG